jgi:hypothetical protein
MSRFAILWFCCAMIAGALLFQTSQRVTDGRQRLENITAEMRREEDSLRVLQAEWSYLNQPERLEKLAAQYLKLAPMKGRQFVAAANLPLRPALADETAADLLATVDQALQESLGAAERAMNDTAAERAADDTAAERSTSDTAAATVLTPLRKPAGLRLPAAFAPPAKTEPPTAKKPAVDTAASHRSFGDVLNSLGTGGNP